MPAPRFSRTLVAIAAAVALSAPAAAALKVGDQAPRFVTKGAKGGKTFTVDLARELRRGPVVLYFFPKAFTAGCTIESQAFADATEDFRKAGATVIGLSADPFPVLQKFSVEACRSKFAVATASPRMINDYDVGLTHNGQPLPMTDRISYVIDRKGRVAMSYASPKPSGHITESLAAVRALSKPR